MATIAVVSNYRPNLLCFQSTMQLSWTALTTTNGDGAWTFLSANYRDRSVQVTGTFGGGTMTIQVSNDPWNATNTVTNAFSAQDTALAAITFTAAGMKTILTPSVWIRPLLSGGDGTTTLNINLFSGGSYAQ